MTQAELFRAADYIAVKLLNQNPPARPASGPAAAVDIIMETRQDTDPHLIEVEHILDTRNYANQAIATIKKANENLKANVKDPNYFVIPDIIISEIPERHNESSFKTPLVVQKTDHNDKRPSHVVKNKTETVSEVSDMIKFSKSICTDESNVIIPQLSDLSISQTKTSNGNQQISSYSSEIIPNISELNMEGAYEENSNIPALSELMGDGNYNESINTGNNSEIYSSNGLSENCIPNLSIINGNNNSIQSNETNTQNSSILSNLNSTISNNVPVNNESSSEFHQNTQISNTSIRTNCNSPLPNLSLNTLLPHFTYRDIETSTNNFDATPHKSRPQVENSLTEDNGRFLGSGAFGSVFLALGLCDRPIAVKKLYINNVSVVNVDDIVTKQFRNEVEVLSKYKHENLLTLIGYSCDGPTYCLLYEYISGGALKDRLLVCFEEQNIFFV